ncbi:TetR/AcrR family transcriptional regulator [Caulobacter sp.]|uniref:TetR/AcrR family transcriptional regulator n=1 Tax=Caulobacter sp. TaxID=78 RepID=UPI001B060D57|nr:TetR/AcrR family transcriptional regulator [Caulobacter sp.]MBO9546423.1 TetR/AcrR family transcriptional regulator [Caulobacter sp.]
MTEDKPPAPAKSRADAMRRRVLDAAERLLHEGRAEFSMRELAASAEVSFATPFNHFGSKAAIMHALSAERIASMVSRFDEAAPKGDAADRVLAAVDIAAAVMLASPEVNRAVIGTIGAPGGEAGQAYVQSRALWARAIADGDGLEPSLADIASQALPDHLALAFRGALSFWTAGEIANLELAARARAVAATLLLGFVKPERREALRASLGRVRPS